MTSFKFLFDLYMSEFLSCKSYQQFSISGLIQFYNEVIDNKGSEATPTDAYKKLTLLPLQSPNILYCTVENFRELDSIFTDRQHFVGSMFTDACIMCTY